MFCKHCGASLEADTLFCPDCGTKVTAAHPVTVSATPAQPVDDTGIMVLSIVGVALCELGLPGLIVSAIARKKVKRYAQNGGALVRKMKVANILSSVGLILGIVFIVYWIISILYSIYSAMLLRAFWEDLLNGSLGEFLNHLFNS